MRADGRREKKLTVAFHFQFANQIAWKCDSCRKSGLEKKRRCGWLPEAELAQPRLVWARGKVTCERCPVSSITADSLYFIEEFQGWRLFGHQDYRSLPARLVEAMFVLENELRMEIRNAQE